MMTLEQTICECIRKEEANRELSKYNKSHVGRANDLKNAEECKQLAEWLRELAERRNAPEIVRCGECRFNDGTAYCVFHFRDVKGNDFCSWAERRTDADD